MKELVKKLTNLIEVKKLIALAVVLALIDELDTTIFTNVVTLIVGYYFGQSTTRQIINENNERKK